MQVFESGPEHVPTLTDTEMNGVPVAGERPPRPRLRPTRRDVPIRRWESGLYFARLRAADGRLGFAPFVVAPRRLGEHRVAVVLPTLTWQAYNFRDDDGDGKPDTWYAGKQENTVRLGRAFLDRGVPYGFRNHLGFLNWLHWTHRNADYLSQWDLEHVASPAALARAYDLIVFPGHHEYVTTREYDLVEGYRDLGGNLMFLSANNFFWRVERKDDLIVKSKRWRDLGRPEARLIGVQYVGHTALASRLLGRAEDAGKQVDVRRDGSGHRVVVRARWRRDRPGQRRIAQERARRRRDPAPLRAGNEGADDVLRDGPRSAGVRRRRVPFHARGDERPGGLEDAREPLGTDGDAMIARHLAVATAIAAGSARPGRRGRGRISVARVLAATGQREAPGERSSRIHRPPAPVSGCAARDPGRAPAGARHPRAARGVGGTGRLAQHRRRRARGLRHAHGSAGSLATHPSITSTRSAIRSRAAAPILDVTRPKALIYANAPGRPLVLVGAMWSTRDGERGPTPAGPIMRWHSHLVCKEGAKRGLKPPAGGTCPPGARLTQGASEMLHVWFTRDLRSAFAIRAPEPELCAAGSLPRSYCKRL